MAATTRTAPFTRAQETRIAEILRGVLGEFAPAPIVSAPAKAKAESEFVGFLRERAAAKVACTIHPAGSCNRRFSPKSSGGTSHVARLV